MRFEKSGRSARGEGMAEPGWQVYRHRQGGSVALGGMGHNTDAAGRGSHHRMLMRGWWLRLSPAGGGGRPARVSRACRRIGGLIINYALSRRSDSRPSAYTHTRGENPARLLIQRIPEFLAFPLLPRAASLFPVGKGDGGARLLPGARCRWIRGTGLPYYVSRAARRRMAGGSERGGGSRRRGRAQNGTRVSLSASRDIFAG